MKKFLLTIAVLGAGMFCAHAQVSEGPQAAMPKNIYKLRHTDELEMSILQEPSITRIFNRISADGYASFPLIGKVHLEGLTLAQAEELLTKLYKQDYFVDPIVVLTIVRYAKQSCFVVGFVNAPQECIFPLEEEDNMTITKVIARCNGFSPRANRSNVVVKRRVNGKDKTFEIDVKEILTKNVSDFPILNGDVIEVRQDIF